MAPFSPLTLSALVSHQARVRADKVALRCEDRETRYSDLERYARQVAAGLSASGIAAGDRIAYFGKNSDRYFELLFGAVHIGAVMTPVNCRLAAPEIEWILRDAGTRALFFDSEFAEHIRPLASRIDGLKLLITMQPAQEVTGFAAWRERFEPIGQRAVGAPGDVAVQMYTSGTTGRPKGAMLTHRNLLVFRSLPPERQPAWNRWTEDDVSLVAMPVFHIGGTGFGLQTLCAGGTAIVVREFDAAHLLELIEHDGLSKFFVVTTALQFLLRHPRVREVDYRRVRTIIYGASPIPFDLLSEAMSVFGCGFVQQYGMTETCGTICALTPEDHDANQPELLRSAGRALENVEIAILDSEGRPLAPRQIGEIAIRSPTNMAGYWNVHDGAVSAPDRDGWIHSGDAGYLDENGYLYVHDRVKDMIVSGGENVYPAEVENALYGHPAVAEVGVIGVPSERWGEEVKALVVLKANAQANAADILAWARARIAAYKLPKSIEFTARLPRNASGKLLRRELREPYWVGRDRRVN